MKYFFKKLQKSVFYINLIYLIRFNSFNYIHFCYIHLLIFRKNWIQHILGDYGYITNYNFPLIALSVISSYKISKFQYNNFNRYK